MFRKIQGVGHANRTNPASGRVTDTNDRDADPGRDLGGEIEAENPSLLRRSNVERFKELALAENRLPTARINDEG